MYTEEDAGSRDMFEDTVGEREPNAVDPVTDSEAASDDSFMNDLLKAHGIGDPSKIKFEGDDGVVSERNWKDLTDEERLNILSPSGTTETSQYSEEEISLINKIREAQLSPSEYLETLKVKETAPTVPSYEIDGISDDELFVLDALDKYGEENITDEQLEALLQNAKNDPDLYEKAIANLRSVYKQREDEYRYREQQEQEAQREQEFTEFSNSILKEIQSLDNLGGQGIELSVDDMNEIANYILSRDDEGNSEFSRTMNDPKKFVELAFWALKGNDVMNEISSQIKAAYDKGVEAGKKGHSPLAFGNGQNNNVTTRNEPLAANSLDVE
jgi:hypothetical protein|uniref:Uncharacterized protein n=1 Tax=Podoviridae sp. ctz6O13 TaxID=2827757 RepID=A0A8S5TK90_9CAUD|nr:MAG TPA: hypothetical protein [Podoviridae sp. ctz6O13]